MSEATPTRTLMAIAKDMDGLKKKITKAESALDAVQKQMAALEAKKKDVVGDIGDLDDEMDQLKKEYEEVMNG